MYFNGKTRRQFLIGSGPFALALPLPLLPSLLPRKAQAATPPPLRFVHCLHLWNHPEATFFPKVPLGTLDAANNVKGALLSDIRGPISKVISSAFDPIRSKMNVIHGLDGVTHGNHNTSIPTCASSNPGKDIATPPIPVSIEYILSNSRKVYPQGATGGIEKYLGVFARGSDTKSRTFPWTPGGGQLPIIADPSAVYSMFMGSFNPVVSDPKTDPEGLMRIKVMDEVYQDYRSVTAAGKISADDKTRLEAYTTLIGDLKSKLAAPVTSCSKDPKPTGNAVADMTNLVAAAMACQLTNVVDFVVTPEAGAHQLGHRAGGGVAGAEDQYSDLTMKIGQIFAGLWKTLDTLKDTDGNTVLDNSVVAWCPTNGIGGAHSGKSLGVVTAGSARGRLRTGHYLDYGSRPINNWLVTAMSALGLEAADYETGGRVGFGTYPGGISDSEKRKPLPFLYK